MKEFSVADLARITGARTPEEPCRNLRATGVSIDSRTTKAGDCFFAIAGSNFDGHDFVSQAFDKGAVCAVLEREPDSLGCAGRCILTVQDTVKALGDIARQYRQRAGFKVVAVTGSAGKTTARQIIHHVLSGRFRVSQSPKSFNNNIGVPLTLLAADPNDQIVVAEIGSNHPGEIAQLTRIALPDIAVITNVYPAHLAGFGDLQTIIEEKSSVSEGLPPGGTLIINGDSPGLLAACRNSSANLLTFGTSDNCDHRAENIKLEGLTSRFSIDGKPVHLPLAGSGNVENALAAWAVCSQFGLKIGDFIQALRSLKPVSMRAQVIQVGTLTVLDDCYNANPASMKNAIEILTELVSARKRRSVCIFGDMAELGDQAERLHAELAEPLVRAKVQLLLTAGRLARITAETAKRKAGRRLEVKCFEDTPSACNNLDRFIEDYDIILIKGSRAANLEMAVDRLKELFS
jgi:UDP-N-acetylmuramoyl-tripeptide--D-alanyl-D-alanine ligase